MVRYMTNPNLFYYTFHKAWQKTNTKTKFEKLDKWKKLKNVTPTKEESEKSLAYLDKKIKQLEFDFFKGGMSE